MKSVGFKLVKQNIYTIIGIYDKINLIYQKLDIDIFMIHGQMNGFVDALIRRNQDGKMAMGYYDDRDIPYYWNIADNFVLFDRFFSSAEGGSVWNHNFWVAGQAGSEKK